MATLPIEMIQPTIQMSHNHANESFSLKMLSDDKQA